MSITQHQARRPAVCDLAIFGLNVPIGAQGSAVEAAFLAVLAAIRLPAGPGDACAVSYNPHACGGRGCARLRLAAGLARAVLSAAPRLQCFCPDISMDVWRTPEERQWMGRPTTAYGLARPRAAEAATSWRRDGSVGLRPAAPAFTSWAPPPPPRDDTAAAAAAAAAARADVAAVVPAAGPAVAPSVAVVDAAAPRLTSRLPLCPPLHAPLSMPYRLLLTLPLSRLPSCLPPTLSPPLPMSMPMSPPLMTPRRPLLSCRALLPLHPPLPPQARMGRASSRWRPLWRGARRAAACSTS